MKRNERNHVRHLAKKFGVPSEDVEARLKYNMTDGSRAIRQRFIRRGRKCTWEQARDRYDAAVVVVNKYLEECTKGKVRRDRAFVPAPTLHERKLRQFLRLYDVGMRPQRMTARKLPGGYYTGGTKWEVKFIPPDQDPYARTHIYDGGSYSRRCYYRKNKAVHEVGICLSDIAQVQRLGISPWVDDEMIVKATEIREDMYEVKTLITKAKRADYRTAYLALQRSKFGDFTHLAKTERAAVTALNRHKRISEDFKTGVVSADLCASWGWCREGMRLWARSHNIRRRIKDRMKIGVRVESLSRLIKRHGGPKDGYEKKLLSLN